jgi:hypothetical protein
MLIKKVCLDDKSRETYEQLKLNISHRFFIGFVFSDCILANRELLSLIFFYGLKKDTLIVDLVIFT